MLSRNQSCDTDMVRELLYTDGNDDSVVSNNDEILNQSIKDQQK